MISVKKCINQKIFYTKNELYIHRVSDIPATFYLYNISGKLVLTSIINEKNQEINLELTKGIYIGLIEQNGKYYSRKILVK